MAAEGRRSPLTIFFSNLPESLVGAVAMRDEGRSAGAVLGLWAACALLLALAVVAGRALAGPLSEPVLSVALGFAGGAVLASLADTLMPEAFQHGRPFNAFATAAGFFVSSSWPADPTSTDVATYPLAGGTTNRMWRLASNSTGAVHCSPPSSGVTTASWIA